MVAIQSRLMKDDERIRLKTFAFPNPLLGWLNDRLASAPNSIPVTRREYSLDYERGVVEVLQIDAVAFGTGEEWNDEGPIYFVDLGGGKILWLCGQWLFDPTIVDKRILKLIDAEEDSWPKRFTIERAPASGFVFHIFDGSDELVRSSNLVQHKDIHYLGYSRVFSGTFSSLESDLARAVESFLNPSSQP